MIGSKPVRYYSKNALDTFERWELMLIVEENGWGNLVSDWDNIPVAQLRDIIKTRMKEPDQQVASPTDYDPR